MPSFRHINTSLLLSCLMAAALLASPSFGEATTLEAIKAQWDSHRTQTSTYGGTTRQRSSRDQEIVEEHFLITPKSGVLIHISSTTGNKSKASAWLNNPNYAVSLRTATWPDNGSVSAPHVATWNLVGIHRPGEIDGAYERSTTIIVSPNSYLTGSIDNLQDVFFSKDYEVKIEHETETQVIVSARRTITQRKTERNFYRCILDKENYFVIQSCRIGKVNGDSGERTFEYRVENGLPILEKMTVRFDEGEASGVYETEADLSQASSDVAATIFTLSHFGLPEPATGGQ